MSDMKTLGDALETIRMAVEETLDANRKQEVDTIVMLERMCTKLECDISDLESPDNVPRDKCQRLYALALLYLNET